MCRRRKPAGWDGRYGPLRMPGGGILWNKPPEYAPPAVELPGDARTALPGLWERARQIWRDICDGWDGPVDLLLRQLISRRSHALICDWLCNLELLVRRIVLIAALGLELKPVRPAPPGPWGTPRFQRTLLRDPSTWKVSFRMFRKPADDDEKKSQGDDEDAAPVPRRPPRHAHAAPTRGLARRLEAVRRVLKWQDAYVLRVARRLARIRARNQLANAPRRFGLTAWDFHPLNRTSGKFSVYSAMILAQPLAARELARWQEPG